MRGAARVQTILGRTLAVTTMRLYDPEQTFDALLLHVTNGRSARTATSRSTGSLTVEGLEYDYT
ncbi:hypothetical protein JOD63_003408 [Microbacterium terrae]|uniref:Uncharacterized protein n=1 Tax=Microbacterium terrae TaxID=69369 RepID=A0A0M2HBP3_9MICO|nr:hypothetical protein RS81_00599 [Microbacterium terrae]MBP1079440.1 hypothetical protein [Microbacterium terrae]GLJ98841.1 hypothetical protein GCM10017594_20380 [Microbacterium terrae]